MIFGQNRLVEIIGAKNLQGYDPYLTDDFTKAFIGGERVVVYYPPDHSLSASTYHFNSDSGTTNSLGVFYSEEDRNVSNVEDSLLKFRKDFVLPYQTNLTIQMGLMHFSSKVPLLLAKVAEQKGTTPVHSRDGQKNLNVCVRARLLSINWMVAIAGVG
jgi:hypothetical protein